MSGYLLSNIQKCDEAAGISADSHYSDDYQPHVKLCKTSMLGRKQLAVSALLCFVPSTRNVSRTLGQSIRAARKKAGLSQEQLAEKADLSRNYIGNVERAEYQITLETLARIAKALNLTVHDLTRDI